MADIIKTWPANVDTREAAQMFNEIDSTFAAYYFALGKGKPAQQLDRLWFTFRGRIVGHFPITRMVVNDGTLPQLHKCCGMSDELWTIRPDYHVAICDRGFVKLRERLFMSGFRGWRYFDIDAYRATPGSRCRL